MGSETSGSRTGHTDTVDKMIDSPEEYIRSGAEVGHWRYTAFKTWAGISLRLCSTLQCQGSWKHSLPHAAGMSLSSQELLVYVQKH